MSTLLSVSLHLFTISLRICPKWFILFHFKVICLIFCTNFKINSTTLTNPRQSPNSWVACVQDLQIISTDDNQVVAAIQDWHQNDSYNLYMSESRGLFFMLMLEDVVSSGGPEDNVMIELYEVGKKGTDVMQKSGRPNWTSFITHLNNVHDFTCLSSVFLLDSERSVNLVQ